MDGLTEILPALGWGQVGATGLVILAIFAIYKGLWVPRGLISREDHLAALDRVSAHADARISDAHSRMEEYRRRAEKAEEREGKWRDAWLVSESGRRISDAYVADLSAAVAPVAQALTSSDSATKSLRLLREVVKE